VKKGLKSLSTKLSVFFIISLSIILFIVVSVVWFFTNQTFNKFLEAESNTALAGLSDTLKGYYVKAQAASGELVQNPNLISAVETKNIYAMTSDVMQIAKGNQLSYTFITDASGNVIAKSNSDGLELDNFSKLKHIQQALQGNLSLSMEIISDKNLSICSGTPIKNGNKIIGVASTVISLDDTTLVDNLKKLTSCEITIFLGDERINTTITKNGKRQIGTKLDSRIAQKVIGEKGTFSGKTTIFGVTHMASYQPILDTNKNVVGAICAGKNIQETERGSTLVVLLSSIIAVLMGIVSTIVLSRFVKRTVKVPLDEVVALANNIENGEIGISHKDAVSLTIYSQDEVGQVADALGNTVNSLQKYIGEISDILSEISNGNLTVKTEHEYYGDFVNIKEALDNITRSLNRTLSDINKSAELVAERSEQISGGAIAISQGATQQASSSQELSATISEISDQIKKTAENASIASSIAKQSTDEVEKGNSSIKEMLTAMENINTASTQISQIIKTIEDIAFQTNILALNAAVEAARAGAAGKGFAVVADEVRNLASKSAEAAKQTSVLINNTVSLVNRGAKTANSTADSFKKIMTSSQKSTDLIAEISKATNTQASAVAQVSLGIEQISNVVQTNSATSEENAAASRDLSMQAQVLRGLVSQFQLNDAETQDDSSVSDEEASDADFYIEQQTQADNEKYE
jgi:methyl-accepting chemotaxis protein